MSELLNGLNEEQKQAVTAGDGPVLVLAGAGTGKTTVITKRIAWLINEKKAKPDEILALTFTDKAAEEMETRVYELVPYGFVDAWISTFHAFGDRIIRENAVFLGLGGAVNILSDSKAVVFFKEHLDALGLKIFSSLGNPEKHVKDILSYFSKLKDENISPSEYLKWSTVNCQRSTVNNEDQQLYEKHLELANAYANYQKLMAENSFLDYGDQIVTALALFRSHKDILARYQKQFKYILVDEFQDTNYAQAELVKMLAGKNANIMVVGDDDQSIYRFRGASTSNILNFTKTYKNSKVIALIKNYRSTKQILDSAYKLISHNNPHRLEVELKISKKLESQTEGPTPKHIHCDTLTNEAHRVAELIKEKNEAGESYKNIAILVRGNVRAEPFVQALNYFGIPYKFSGSSGLYSRPEIRLIIQFLRAVSDPLDNLAFYHLITSEIYGLNETVAIYISNYARKTNKHMEKICAETESIDLGIELSEANKTILNNFCQDIEFFRSIASKYSAGEFIYELLKKTGYLKSLITKSDAGDALSTLKIENIAQFFKKVTEFENISQEKSIMAFVRDLDILMEAGENPAVFEVDADIDAVNILTIHKSKGLEFNVVFLASLVTNIFPSRMKTNFLDVPAELSEDLGEEIDPKEAHIAEERRLFYVGITRAKKELFLTSAEDYGGKRVKKISPFVLEALEFTNQEFSKTKTSAKEFIERFQKTDVMHTLPKRFWEKDVIVLTPHQIDDYLSCPKKFEYIHVLRIPILKDHRVVYGSAMHKAIEYYYRLRVAEKLVTATDLHKIFEESWNSEGFISAEHEQKRFEAGKKALTEFFEREKNRELPTAIEAPFSVYFENLVEKNAVRINGRYDAVFNTDSTDRKTNGTNNKSVKSGAESLNQISVKFVQKSVSSEIEIRDFKTSEVLEDEKAEDKAKKNRQLAIYALAYEQLNGKLPEFVSLYFVDSGILAKVSKKPAELEKTRGEIKTVVEGLLKNDFKAKPGFNECSWCAYSADCPYTLTKS